MLELKQHGHQLQAYAKGRLFSLAGGIFFRCPEYCHYLPSLDGQRNIFTASLYCLHSRLLSSRSSHDIFFLCLLILGYAFF
jgi:hypothetical protein